MCHFMWFWLNISWIKKKKFMAEIKWCFIGSGNSKSSVSIPVCILDLKCAVLKWDSLRLHTGKLLLYSQDQATPSYKRKYRVLKIAKNFRV